MKLSKEIENSVYKFILKERLSSAERRLLNHWISSEKNSHQILGQLKLIVEANFESEKNVKKSEVWEAIVSNEITPEEPVRTVKTYPNLKQFLKVAAVFLIASLFVILPSKLNDSPEQVVLSEKWIEKVALEGQKITTILSDGTEVKLNSGSKLIVPEKFSGSAREVTLEGEAFFDVVRDEKKPFIVNVNNQMTVQVLGTSFVINTGQGKEGEKAIVAVASGSVTVKKAADDNSVVLKKNETVKFSESQTLSKEAIHNKDILFGWVENKFVLADANFDEVLASIKKWFGFEIETKIDYSDFDQYSATLTNPGIKEVMESLSHSFKFEYKIDRKNKRITIN